MSTRAKQSVYAVLTGDILGSTRMGSRRLDSAVEHLFSSINQLDTWSQKRKVIRGAPEVFRGDGWQLLLAQPQFAFRAALYLRARLIASGSDSRVSIAIGTAERISRTSIARSSGDVFIRSGRGLDGMKTDAELAISLPEHLHDTNRWLTSIVELSGAVVQGWSKRQAEVVSLAMHLNDASQRDIANRLKVSHQLVSKTLKAARWEALKSAAAAFEDFDWAKHTPHRNGPSER